VTIYFLIRGDVEAPATFTYLTPGELVPAYTASLAKLTIPVKYLQNLTLTSYSGEPGLASVGVVDQ